VLRRYNEAADTLTKAASNRKSVPNGVFTSDLREPSVRYDEDDHPSGLEPRKVMALGEASEPNLADLDWRIPILGGWWNGSSRSTALGCDASHVEPNPSYSSTRNSIGKARPGNLCAATNCCETYMRGPASIMPPPGPSLAALSSKVSTGPQQSQTPRASYAAAKAVSSTRDKYTSRRKHCRPSPSPSPSCTYS
jgi:hypothetical protein